MALTDFETIRVDNQQSSIFILRPNAINEERTIENSGQSIKADECKETRSAIAVLLVFASRKPDRGRKEHDNSQSRLHYYADIEIGVRKRRKDARTHDSCANTSRGSHQHQARSGAPPGRIGRGRNVHRGIYLSASFFARDCRELR